MKKLRKTYGIQGKIEFLAVIFNGKARLEVPFTDGSVNAVGRKPATFTTDNPVVQIAIERSEPFRKRFIRLYSIIELDEDIRVERNPRSCPECAIEADSDSGSEEVPAEPEYPVEDSEEDQEEPADTTGEVPVKEFSNNEDARNYFVEAYGIAPSKLRRKKQIIAVAEQVGEKIAFV